ncbi:hypothetical protein [Synechococcus sp. CS-205]|uniref:hypothetical protein n=1 Tax=Synechococcus sp. CS-205 TaxID=2847984 RepID=UPI00223BADEF|nr:hypothetical protein [Synechococcus sp. CS-205]MCT0247671.1 hypothetical protein [Synechococcus sp. CS-205]
MPALTLPAALHQRARPPPWRELLDLCPLSTPANNDMTATPEISADVDFECDEYQFTASRISQAVHTAAEQLERAMKRLVRWDMTMDPQVGECPYALLERIKREITVEILLTSGSITAEAADDLLESDDQPAWARAVEQAQEVLRLSY